MNALLFMGLVSLSLFGVCAILVWWAHREMARYEAIDRWMYENEVQTFKALVERR